MSLYRQAREAKGLTQTDVAKQVGVSLTSYQLWEREVSKPNSDNEKKLNEVLGLGDKK